MAKNPSPSLLDPGQIIKRAFNDSDDSIRVDATIVASVGDVKITDGSVDATITTVGPKNGLDVNVLNDLVVDINQATDSIAIGDGTNLAKFNVDGSLNVNLEGLSTFQTSQYSIGTSAVQITSIPLSNRSSVGLKATTTTSSNAIFIGNSSSVMTSTGYPLFNGDTLQLDLTGADTIYAISSASGQRLYVVEIGT